MALDLATWMYEHLPAMMRYRDENEHLKNLISVLAEGLVGIREDVENFVQLVDVDNCPAEMLPHLGAMLGFEFPYDLPEDQQRNFIRSIVSLYRVKGTPMALKFVASRLIGGGFRITVENEDHVAKTFDVKLTADQDSTLLSQLENKLAYLVGIYSPAGMIPSIVVVYYSTEELEAAMDDSNHTTQQYTSWRMNFQGHRMNDNVVLNGFGTVTLPI